VVIIIGRAPALVSSSSAAREESHGAQAWFDRYCGCCAARGGADGVPGLAGRRSGRPGRGHGGSYSIVVLTQDNPTMAYGITTIEKIAEAINRDLR